MLQICGIRSEKFGRVIVLLLLLRDWLVLALLLRHAGTSHASHSGAYIGLISLYVLAGVLIENVKRH